jgi:hypothetical protein
LSPSLADAVATLLKPLQSESFAMGIDKLLHFTVHVRMMEMSEAV